MLLHNFWMCYRTLHETLSWHYIFVIYPIPFDTDIRNPVITFNPFQDSLDEILRTVLCFSPICLLIFKNSNSELKLALLLFCSGLAIFLQFYRYFSILKHWHSQIHYWQIPRNFGRAVSVCLFMWPGAIQISRKFNRLAMRCHFNDFAIFIISEKVFSNRDRTHHDYCSRWRFFLKKRLAVLLSVSTMLILGILLSLEFDVKLDGISSKPTNLWFALFELDKVSDQTFWQGSVSFLSLLSYQSAPVSRSRNYR